MKLLKNALLPGILLSGLILLSLVYFFIYRINIRQGEGYNVLLISIDSLRSDHLGCYGYKRNTSPFIDRLAKDGIIFQKAFAQSSHSPTSLGTILTSTLPNKHHLINYMASLNNHCITLSATLQQQGYETIFISPNMVHMKGFSNGFSQFLTPRLSGEKITFKAIDFLEGNPKKKFFIWIHYFDTHYPYQENKLYPATNFTNDSLFDKSKKISVSSAHVSSGPVKGVPAGTINTKGAATINPDSYIAQYDSSIRAVDQYIGILVSALKATRRYENTLIIITADHGEMLGEKGYYFQHGYFLYQPLIHIPLIVICKGRIPANKEYVYPLSAHLVIAPTILDILGLTKVGSMDGESLMDILNAKPSKIPHEVWSDEGGCVKSLIEDEWKIIYNCRSQDYELYNLNNDQGEENNLKDKERVIFDRLSKKLDNYHQYVPPENSNKASSLSEFEKQKLKSLGYTQ